MSQQLSQQRLSLSRVATVPPTARVRHFDELEEATQAFVAHVAAGRRTDGDAPDLLDGDAPDLFDGDVVVFTDYFSVTHA